MPNLSLSRAKVTNNQIEPQEMKMKVEKATKYANAMHAKTVYPPMVSHANLGIISEKTWSNGGAQRSEVVNRKPEQQLRPKMS